MSSSHSNPELTGAQLAALAKQMPGAQSGTDTKGILVGLFKGLYHALNVPSNDPALIDCLNLKFGLSRNGDLSRISKPLNFLGETSQIIKSALTALEKLKKPSVQAHTKAFAPLQDATNKLTIKREELAGKALNMLEERDQLIKKIMQKLTDHLAGDKDSPEAVNYAQLRQETESMNKKIRSELLPQIAQFIKELITNETAMKKLAEMTTVELPPEQRPTLGTLTAPATTEPTPRLGGSD